MKKVFIANTTSRPLTLKYLMPVKGLEDKTRVERLHLVPGIANPIDADHWEKCKNNKMAKIWLKEKMIMEVEEDDEVGAPVEAPDGFKEKEETSEKSSEKSAGKKSRRRNK